MKNLVFITMLSLFLGFGVFTGVAFAQNVTVSPTPTPTTAPRTTNDVLDVGENADGAVDVGTNAQDEDTTTPEGAPKTGKGGMAR